MVLNWLFFGFIIVGSLFVQIGLVQVYSWPFDAVFPVDRSNALFLFGFIFANNLVLSGFVLMTLTGFVFFGLSAFFLCFRALLWGVLLNGLSTPMFLVVLPTLVLEGEGYVLAAATGVILGLSWLRPKSLRGGDDLSHSEAVVQGLKECVRFYFLVALILFAAAVVETVTLVYI